MEREGHRDERERHRERESDRQMETDRQRVTRDTYTGIVRERENIFFEHTISRDVFPCCK